MANGLPVPPGALVVALSVQYRPRRAAIGKEAHMGAQRTSFEKLQRDRAKKAKQALKRERRHNGEAVPDTEDEAPVTPLGEGGELSADELLTQIALIHKQLDDKTISFEEFEELKADLMARLPID
jgi:hypothetical protein